MQLSPAIANHPGYNQSPSMGMQKCYNGRECLLKRIIRVVVLTLLMGITFGCSTTIKTRWNASLKNFCVKVVPSKKEDPFPSKPSTLKQPLPFEAQAELKEEAATKPLVPLTPPIEEKPKEIAEKGIVEEGLKSSSFLSTVVIPAILDRIFTHYTTQEPTKALLDFSIVQPTSASLTIDRHDNELTAPLTVKYTHGAVSGEMDLKSFLALIPWTHLDERWAKLERAGEVWERIKKGISVFNLHYLQTIRNASGPLFLREYCQEGWIKMNPFLYGGCLVLIENMDKDRSKPPEVIETMRQERILQIDKLAKDILFINLCTAASLKILPEIDPTISLSRIASFSREEQMRRYVREGDSFTEQRKKNGVLISKTYLPQEFVLTESHFYSTSEPSGELVVAEELREHYNVTYTIEPATHSKGKSMAPFAGLTTEREVLFPPGTQFAVLKVILFENANRECQIHLKEL